ncbi:uncharacterized protein LOC108896450 isoform X3 [Lates calcarifer]|uniref:Uncharacterized protein LOC108896450 isoform X3 n=1 Tax=Lates calcarifer TaxID=8187 RepID=A0AAJ8DPS1_LATCA|nr:uncharacterized protein LOC108896450 isoform X3 [Lates calcarifer]
MIDSNILNQFPRIHLVKNQSSYDLLITNISDSDEGLYYCGTEQKKVDDSAAIKHVYRYGKVTRIILYHSTYPEIHHFSRTSDVSWMMVFTPAFTILSSFLSFMLVFHICQKTAKDPQVHMRRPDTKHQTRWNQDEDVFLTRVVFRAQDQ